MAIALFAAVGVRATCRACRLFVRRRNRAADVRRAVLALGAAVAVTGVFIDGAELATYHWRGPLFVMLAIVAFAISIRPLVSWSRGSQAPDLGAGHA